MEPGGSNCLNTSDYMSSQDVLMLTEYLTNTSIIGMYMPHELLVIM